ncbi:MAG: DEAD/DEAH box helicase family protein [Ignavibacterium sp.]|nr:DEAD/DEAH box helicase family protein [Ignavibacterium sp.]
MTNNFKYLHSALPELALLGESAEQYIYADPSTAAVKLRLFVEKFVHSIYQIQNLPQPEEDKKLISYLINPPFVQLIPEKIKHLLHSIRIQGNNGAHGKELDSTTALTALRQAHNLGKWIYATYCKGNLAEVAAFVEPEKQDKSDNWQKEKFEVLKDLYEKDLELNKALELLDKEKEKVQQISESKKELEKLVETGYKIANELEFTEEQTRKILIDELLTDVGWKVDPNGKDTVEVKQEFQVDGQPTDTGIGFADYVLFEDNGKPLAVVEAKKTSVSVEKGRTQAKLYADSLEKKFGQRPVIIYTNGYEIYLWNDAANEPPRPVYGMYSKDSLQYLIFQRSNQVKASEIKINYDITDRPYQIEAIKRVIEKFEAKGRKSLIVQATGTGKTRVAISICDVLTRANSVKRILFLCDRRELRKQAKNVFQEYLPGSPLTILSAATSKDRDKRIYLATYPAMNQYYRKFDIGFFDLIIADESHRSIYKAYKDIFSYFDCLQIGLTATPVSYVHRHTFKMFDCKPDDPTAHFSYDDAITNNPPYLSTYEVFTVTTKFMRDGIKYADLNRDQQLELEEQVAEPEAIDYESSEIDRYIYNKDTNRHIIRNLMENGMKLPDGKLGKTIIFARNHRHAIMLQEAFDELYKQYGGKFCQVIDNYDPRAEQLIDDLKGIGTNPDLTIAISVDMLDTGIDIPEVLNLVFAKPLKSFVKFWQMIGRGTRLRKDLFGPGKDKSKFRIFDHWGNFEWFDLYYKSIEPSVSKSLMQRLFEERILLAENALTKFDKDTFNLVTDLILKDIATLASTDTISVKEHLRDIKQLQSEALIKNFSGETKNHLKNIIAPLMQWINIYGENASYSFDLLVTKLQNSILLQTGKYDDLKGEILNQVNSLKRNLNQVKAKSDILQKVISKEFWKNISIQELEKVRIELRSIMKFKEGIDIQDFKTPTIDVTDEDIQYNSYHVKNKGIEMAAYRERVEEVLNKLFERSTTLQKIKSGQAVNDRDIEELVSLVLTQHPDLNLKMLQEFYPETAGHLDLAIRRIIGLDSKYLDEQFTKFVHNHPELVATQVKFIQMLKNHISKYGTLKLENLFEAPFTSFHTEGVYGIFPDENQAREIINIVKEITYPYNQPRAEE